MRITTTGVVIGVLVAGLAGCEDTVTVDPAAPPTTDVPIFTPPPRDAGAPTDLGPDAAPADAGGADARVDAAPA
ncbi:MAG: hypothetical protein H6704_21925 [Myxococcales bacterium]|nr:hypothetical protein [Myxococcales bacterium]